MTDEQGLIISAGVLLDISTNGSPEEKKIAVKAITMIDRDVYKKYAMSGQDMARQMISHLANPPDAPYPSWRRCLDGLEWFLSSVEDGEVEEVLMDLDNARADISQLWDNLKRLAYRTPNKQQED